MNSILSSLASFTCFAHCVSRRSLLPLTAFAPLVNSARSISRNSEVKSRETTRDPSNPSTPGTDIAHKSVLNITPSVKMERDIMSNMGARNAGVCFFVWKLYWHNQVII